MMLTIIACIVHDKGGHPLADPQEHALKVKACKDAQKDPDFCVVARVEVCSSCDLPYCDD